MIEKTKKYFLVLSLICSIFTNINQILNINKKMSDENSSFLKKLNYLKDISNFGYDILSCNIISIAIHFWCYFKRIKGIVGYIKNKILRKKE
jgi:hypothetical protein